MKIVIPGGSGQVGHILARSFQKDGHDVVVLARRVTIEPWRVAAWDGETLGAWAKEIDGADAVVNLAGRSVNCRYNAENRRQIVESRVRSTKVVGEAIARAASPPRVWLNASTATIYRHALDRPMDEATGELGGDEASVPETWTFSIGVAKAWEEELARAATPRTRKIAMRAAMTMSPDANGIFDVLLGLVRKGLGGTIAGGRQFVSWIHEEDFVRAARFVIERAELSGAVNFAAPNPLPQEDFMRAIREVAGVRFAPPAAKWMVAVGARMMGSETELVLKSRRVVPGRLLEAGFVFDFASWPEAAKDLVARWRAGRSGPHGA